MFLPRCQTPKMGMPSNPYAGLHSIPKRLNTHPMGGDCPLPVVLDHAGLPRGSCPAYEMPESRWVAPLALVLVFLLALGVSLLTERRRK